MLRLINTAASQRLHPEGKHIRIKLYHYVRDNSNDINNDINYHLVRDIKSDNYNHAVRDTEDLRE